MLDIGEKVTQSNALLKLDIENKANCSFRLEQQEIDAVPSVFDIFLYIPSQQQVTSQQANILFPLVRNIARQGTSCLSFEHVSE